jgi:phosphinothricin acetyltransferase
VTEQPVVVRPATPADVPAVTGIYAHHVVSGVATFDTEPPGEDHWTGRLEDAAQTGWPFLVAEADGEVVGFAYADTWRRARPAYRHTVEDTLYLRPGWTRRGIGRALLTELLDRAAANGAREVLAVIADGGDPSSAELHRALGFTEAGRLRGVGFKHGRWLDTVLVQRSLG